MEAICVEGRIRTQKGRFVLNQALFFWGKQEGGIEGIYSLFSNSLEDIDDLDKCS